MVDGNPGIVGTGSPLTTAGMTLDGVLVFVAAQGEETYPAAFQLMQELRTQKALLDRKIVVEGGFFQKKLGAQLTLADRLGAAYCVIMGQEELERGEVTFRSLKESAQNRIPRQDLVAHLLKLPYA